MSHLPKITIDTNIFINVKSGKIASQIWQKAKKYIRQSYRYRLSYVTCAELQSILSGCSQDDFVWNKGHLSLLPMGQSLRPSEVLELPVPFAIKKSLGIDISPSKAETPEVRRKVLEALRALRVATSKKELKDGVCVGNSIITHDLDDVRRRSQRLRAENVDRLKKLRSSSMCKHAELILTDAGVEQPTPDQVAKFCQDIDAMLRMSACFQAMMRNKNFDSAKHASHLDDAYQLLYLSDPEMRILTMDKKEFVIRTAGSPQQDRIILWNDFVAQIQRDPP